MADEGNVRCCDMEALANVKREKKFYQQKNRQGNIHTNFNGMLEQMLGSRYTLDTLKRYVTAANHLDTFPDVWAFIVDRILHSTKPSKLKMNAFGFAAFWKEDVDVMIDILKKLDRGHLKGKLSVLHNLKQRAEAKTFLRVYLHLLFFQHHFACFILFIQILRLLQFTTYDELF